MNKAILGEKKWWQASNFYIHALLAITALWGYMKPELVTELVTAVFAIGGGFGLIRDHFKTGTFDKSKFFTSNWWAYIGTMFTAMTGLVLPDTLFQAIPDLLESLAGKNYPVAITAILTILSIIYGIIKPKVFSALNIKKG